MQRPSTLGLDTYKRKMNVSVQSIKQPLGYDGHRRHLCNHLVFPLSDTIVSLQGSMESKPKKELVANKLVFGKIIPIILQERQIDDQTMCCDSLRIIYYSHYKLLL